MNRIWGHLLTGLLTAGGLGALIAACAHDDSSVFVEGVLAPPATGAVNGVCTYLPDPTQPHLFAGTLDVALTSGYAAHVLVGNQLAAHADQTTLRTETSRVTLQGAIVHVQDPTTGDDISSFTSLGTGFADPAVSGQPGFGLVGFLAIDSQTTDLLRPTIPAGGSKTVVARFKVFGQTLGGTDVETDEYQYPITVCSGCLVAFPSDSQDQALATATGKANCAAPLSSTSGGTSCAIGQDQPVDCRQCQGNPVCDPANR